MDLLRRPDRLDNLNSEIEKLTVFIISEYGNDIRPNESLVDTTIRLLRARANSEKVVSQPASDAGHASEAPPTGESAPFFPGVDCHCGETDTILFCTRCKREVDRR